MDRTEIKVASARLREIVTASPALEKLGAVEGLPGSLAVKIAKLLKWFAPHTGRFAQERVAVFTKLGATKSGESSLTLPTEKMKEVEETMRPMLEEMVDFDPGMRLNVSDLESVKLVAVTAADLVTLSAFLVGL